MTRQENDFLAGPILGMVLATLAILILMLA